MKKLNCTLLIMAITICMYAQEKQTAWKFKSNNSLAYAAGNVNTFDAMTTNEIEHEDSTYEFAFNYQFLYGEQNKKRYQLEHAASVYYDYRPHKRLSPWVNATLLNNQYKGFVMRFNTAAGLKYRFLYSTKHDWSLSAGILFDHSNFTAPLETGVAQRNDENIIRLSIRPKIKIKFSKSAQLKHVTFYQPEIKDFDNFIVWSQTDFSVKLVEHISISARYYYFYNSHPAYATISKTDQRMLFEVKVEL